MSEPHGPQAKFTAMTEGTQEDWMAIAGHAAEFGRGLPKRLIAHLNLLDGDFGGVGAGEGAYGSSSLSPEAFVRGGGDVTLDGLVAPSLGALDGLGSAVS